MVCPHCHQATGIKYGFSGSGRQVMRCRACRRIFVAEPSRPRVSRETKAIARALALVLGQPLTVPIIAQATGLSERSIYNLKRSAGA